MPKETYYQTFKGLCKPENVNDDVTIAFSEEQLMEIVINSGAIDFTDEDDFFEVTTEANDFNKVLDIFKENDVKYLNAELTLRAETLVNLDQDMSEKVFNIMEFMDDLDDVQEVHTNAEFPDNFQAKE